ncbi:MAG TPA: DUF1552 domain-containing protein [Terriglobia bacterium]|nr:DUF1552 domain-containing protein [Terriglobia bacterium]
MFITKKHIPRRTFLRGSGVTLALPFLESMLPAQTPLRQTAASPGAVKRFVGIWHPHGAAPGYWSPLQEGPNFEFSFITKPLEPFRDRVVLITGLDSTGSAATADEPGGDHARGANLLSGARPRRDSVSPYLGVTIDQMIANKYGKDTLLSSIQLGIEDPGNNTGNCNWGYSCSYSNSISWPTPTTPLPTEINPRMAFERLFGDGASADERVIDRKRTGSILDSVTREIARLKKGVPAGDQVKLDNYLENVREIERRIQNITSKPEASGTSFEVPFGIPTNNDSHFKIMYDLIAVSFQADITRVATLMLGRDLSSTNFPTCGWNGPWHGTSHHGDIPANKANYSRINRYHVQNLAYFCEKLRNTPDGDGNVLDHVLIYKGTNMGNSHRHAHEKIPVELVGGVDGKFKGNRHIVFPDNTQRNSNMLLSILDMYDIHLDHIGDSTGRLPGLV